VDSTPNPCFVAPLRSRGARPAGRGRRSCAVGVLLGAAMCGVASAGDTAFLDLTLDGNGATESFQGLPEAIGPVVVSFESRTFRSYDEYGGGECFERTFSIDGTPLVELGCPQWSGCETVSDGVTIAASQFNAWREGGLDVGMGWRSSTCGLDWSIRVQYPFLGVARVDQFVGGVGTSEGLPAAADDVFIQFTSTTYRSCDGYGGCTCYGRSLSFEDGATLSIDCPNGSGCLQASAVRVVDAGTFNAWLEGGVDLTMDWDWSICGLEWSVRYVYTTIEDCNGNGRPDEEDVALGLSPDCNGDGIPDDCQGIERIDLAATSPSPFGAGLPASFLFDDLPEALADVELRVEALADLDAGTEVVIPVLDGQQFPTLFAKDGRACDQGSSTASIILSPKEFAALAGDGGLEIELVATPAVDPDACPTTAISVRLTFAALTEAADCDGDGEIDLCEPGYADCDEDGIPDACEAIGDCNGNGVPDECDLADGTAVDCHGNGVPDACDIASGFDLDCDGNGLADACELLVLPGLDKNDNGLHDACEYSRGDLDLDGEVGPSDLAILLSLWGLVGDFETDLDGDGIVGPGDLSILLANWLSTPTIPCGNGIVNAFEDCASCPDDVACGKNQYCAYGTCLPCPPDPYGGRDCGYGGYGGYGGLAGRLDGYRIDPDGGLDANFRQYSRLPMPTLSWMAAGFALLGLGLLRLR